jgi:diaminobutyrate-2-oxoglutarate transaminase
MLTESEILARQAARESNARTYPRRLPVAIAEARGCEIRSVSGETYLDFFAGAGVLAVGHNHPRVVEAVRRQLDQVVHTLDPPTPTRDAFVDALLDLLPAGEARDDWRVHVCAPTGSDAVEAALKLCKIATGRGAVLSFQGGYHGMTAGALGVASWSALKGEIRGLMPEVHFAPYAYCHRCPLGLRRDRCEVACANFVDTVLQDGHSGVPTPAAALIELVQGEGGSIVPDATFVRRLRAATRAAGVPLIADEIQAGLGRTGRWWSFEHFDIVPDVILTSKALGGIGLPIAAILYRKSLDVWQPGSHIGTFRGHQLAMAAGLAGLQVMREEGLLENAATRGAQLLEGLGRLRCDLIGDVRGKGLLIGIELEDPVTGRPLADAAREVQRMCFEDGLIFEVGGREDATLRLLPPLVVSEVEVQRALDIIASALATVESRYSRLGAVA